MTSNETISSSINHGTSYAEVLAAFQIIRTLRIEHLKLNPDLFSEPLYRDTILYRVPEEDGYQGANEVLMKNVYYMATLTENVSDAVVDTLFANDILTEEEALEIRKQPTNKLRGVKMFAYLIKKEDPDNIVLARILAVLKENNNETLAALLGSYFDNENHEIPDGVGADAVVENNNEDADEINGAHARVANEGEEGNWTCRFCTFLNNPGIKICDMCARTDNSDPEDIIDVIFCPKCTLVNPAGSNQCNACEWGLNEESDDDDD
ncbi:unnamed protein product [Orchesella dallaii]|uniref:RanBP2-type domain-containing protein n=1 Tax=Orchesella dallaii TaxID=48710 RepID=A0ABP1QRD0_9HEXA